MSPATVLFVSKPVDPPINDGTKHVVVTIAKHMTRHKPRVMTTQQCQLVAEGVERDAIYEAASSYAPSLVNNARAASHLAFGPKRDLWNFVFAPNTRSSQMGRWLRRLRAVPVVQTIASRPLEWEGAGNLLFGDIVVAQSRDTRDRLLSSWASKAGGTGSPPRVEVILPPLGTVPIPTLDDTSAVRKELNVGPDVPLLLYPGDLEVSHGARLAKAAAVVIAQRHPTATIVFAYRDKTPNAARIAAELQRELNPNRVRLVREARDILGLVRTSAAILFPVDDLYGKIDIPIVLLQAMALATPVITYNQGPLADLGGVEIVRSGDPFALADAALALVDEHDRRGRVIEAQQRAIESHHDAGRVAAAYEALYDELLSRTSTAGAPPKGRRARG